MDIKDGAKVFIKNEKLGKYLFELRYDDLAILNPNMYGLLGGGIEVRETPIEALEREMQEETNVIIYDIEKLGNKIASFVVTQNGEQKKVTNTLFFFLAKTDAILGEAELYEGQKLDYFTIEEALGLENLTSATREAINDYRETL